MIHKLAALGLAFCLLAGTARAEEAIGSSYYGNDSVSGTFDIVPAASNPYGLHIKTIAVSCGPNIAIKAIPPTAGAVPRIIFACNPVAGSARGTTQMQSAIYLPAGYELQFWSGTLGTPTSGLYVTYDLNSGP
jgi:hypothetical protein